MLLSRRISNRPVLLLFLPWESRPPSTNYFWIMNNCCQTKFQGSSLPLPTHLQTEQGDTTETHTHLYRNHTQYRPSTSGRITGHAQLPSCMRRATGCGPHSDRDCMLPARAASRPPNGPSSFLSSITSSCLSERDFSGNLLRSVLFILPSRWCPKYPKERSGCVRSWSHQQTGS